MQTIEVQVTGEQTIHCDGCEQRISNALRRLPGVEDVQASAQTQQVQVRFDPSQVNCDQVQARLEKMGYQVMLLGGGT
jgi:copper chaperone CopZ